MKMDNGKNTHIAIFNGKSIRRKFFDDKWFFSVVDVVGVLSESPRPRKYWSGLKIKLKQEGFELSAKIGQLKLKPRDGKEDLTDCADTEGIFRIIQSIPSKKAEPFKRWLARVGYERIKEIEKRGEDYLFKKNGQMHLFKKILSEKRKNNKMPLFRIYLDEKINSKISEINVLVRDNFLDGAARDAGFVFNRRAIEDFCQEVKWEF